MLGAEIRANYFAELAGRYSRRQRIATWGTLLFSSGSVASLLAGWPQSARLTVAAITAGISAYSVVMGNQKLSVDAADLHFRWGKLADDYQRLWDEIDAPDAVARLDSLITREQEISKTSTAFPNDEHLMGKWETHVVAHRTAHA